MSWILRNSRIAIRFSMYDEARNLTKTKLRMRILQQEKELTPRSSIILFKDREGLMMTIATTSRPSLESGNINVRGSDKRTDHWVADRDFSSSEEREKYLKRAIESFSSYADMLGCTIILRGHPTHYIDVLIISKDTAEKLEHARTLHFGDIFSPEDG